MASVHELCDILPFPPEIVVSITQHLHHCHQCLWTDKSPIVCLDCKLPICFGCATRCAEEQNCICAYCKCCAPKRWCPEEKVYVCTNWVDTPTPLWISRHPCSHGKGTCTDCHRKLCYDCQNYFCCNHYVTLPSYEDYIYACFTCWPYLRDKLDAKMERRNKL